MALPPVLLLASSHDFYQAIRESDWEFTPSDLPGMLDYARDLWGDRAGVRLELLAEEESRKAAQIREAYREAQAAESDALALAALPPAEQLEKITRYEAHLERVLYRALHDLEASRRDREGKESPPPLRGVLDAQGEPLHRSALPPEVSTPARSRG